MGRFGARKRLQPAIIMAVIFWSMKPCPDQLKERVVQPIDDLLEARNIELVFSAMPPNVWHLEQRLLDAGYTVFSNSPYGRFEENNPLVVAEVNRDQGSKVCQNPELNRPEIPGDGFR
jgi:aspartate-semialdehyde dehydrogenase